MRSYLLLVAILVGCATALPMENENQVDALQNDVGTKNTALEQLVLDILEQVRGIMVTGSGDIPVLDPLNLDHVRLDLGLLGFDGAHVEATNFVLNQLSSFVIDRLSITSFLLIRYTIEVEAHLPVIDFQSENYDLNVTFVGFRIFGNGELAAKVTAPRVKATIVVSPRVSLSGLFIQINSADIQIALDAFEPTFTGLFENELANDFINVFLEELIPEIVVYFEDDITAILNEVVLEVGNQILAELDLGSILGRDNVQKFFGPLLAETPEILR